jgi:hypothetical protein
MDNKTVLDMVTDSRIVASSTLKNDLRTSTKVWRAERELYFVSNV